MPTQQPSCHQDHGLSQEYGVFPSSWNALQRRSPATNSKPAPARRTTIGCISPACLIDAASDAMASSLNRCRGCRRFGRTCSTGILETPSGAMSTRAPDVATGDGAASSDGLMITGALIRLPSPRPNRRPTGFFAVAMICLHASNLKTKRTRFIAEAKFLTAAGPLSTKLTSRKRTAEAHLIFLYRFVFSYRFR